ncbi:MAG TPA: hypothetical protein VFO76_00910 [Candidatus Kapabacteria bacterium]|nr:hypothetical protein [Candidatus Kapabacteria bacterium]
MERLNKAHGKKEEEWISVLKYDPLPPLLLSKNAAIAFFAEREFAHKKKNNSGILRELPVVQYILRKQRSDGSWKYPRGNDKIRSQENYDQIETFRNLGYLIELYGFDRKDIEVASAIEFLFSFQTPTGDIRGILGNQYTPYYTAAMIELFVKAGFSSDKRVEKAFKWFDSIRQYDGGWAIPFRTRNKLLSIISIDSKPIEPDTLRPFSHLVTGVVLRAYAAHPHYRKSPTANKAGQLLLQSIFRHDAYPDRKDKSCWLKFTFPFWFTDLISAMDTLSWLGFSKQEPQIEKAIGWFINHQQSNGLWRLPILKNKSIFDTELWLSLAICRLLKRFYLEAR